MRKEIVPAILFFFFLSIFLQNLLLYRNRRTGVVWNEEEKKELEDLYNQYKNIGIGKFNEMVE